MPCGGFIVQRAHGAERRDISQPSKSADVLSAPRFRGSTGVYMTFPYIVTDMCKVERTALSLAFNVSPQPSRPTHAPPRPPNVPPLHCRQCLRPKAILHSVQRLACMRGSPVAACVTVCPHETSGIPSAAGSTHTAA